MPREDGEKVVVGRYALGARLGSGGMGTVWHGRDQLLNRDVAVKQVRIPDTMSDVERDEVEARVLREARAAAQLNHAGAVSVYDVAQDDGQAYIVMELVTAPTLADLVERDGPMQPARAARIGLEILAALEAAHEKGIVHRDVKPANVMVPETGGVKLTDFGIASLVDDPRITSTGLILGSPAYMAPEQAQEQESSAATDLWGLGTTLYYAVTGRPPFQKPNPIATLTAVLNDDIEVPAEAGELGPVISALMSKDPAARPDPAELARTLDRISGGDGTMPLQREAIPTQTVEESPRTAPLERAEPRVAEPEPTPAAPVALPPEPATPAYDEDYDDEMPRRRPVWIVAVAALAAGALLLFMMLNQEEDPSGVQDGVPEAKERTEETQPGDSLAEVPANWQEYTDPQTGYQISYPPGWEVVDPGTSNGTDFRDPESGSYMRVDWRSPPGESAVEAWEVSSAGFETDHENYEEIRIDATTYNGWEAAEWEYTYTDGVDLHAINLGFIVSDEYGFALNFQTHEENWAPSQDVFEAFKASFEPPA